MSGVVERGLGMALRRFRERAGMTCEEVGEVLGWSANTISRLERGLRRGTRPDEVSALLAGMGVIGNERDTVMRMARGHREHGWWEENDSNISDQARTYMAFEVRAASIVDVEPMLVPGLLQTPDYYRAVLHAFDVDPLLMNGRIARRLHRQALLDCPYTSFDFIVTELMMRQPLGGAAVMARQIRKMIRESERRNISLRVLPETVVAHPALHGPFVVLEFAEETPVVFIEGRGSGLFPDSPDEIKTYSTDAERTNEMALTEQDSLALLHEIAKAHEIVANAQRDRAEGGIRAGV